MPRPKATNWEPPSIYGATVCDGLRDEFYRKIVSDHLGSGSDARMVKIQSRIRGVLRNLELGLIYSQRPSDLKKHAALSKASKALHTAIDSIRALDADSRSLVERASEGDEGFIGYLPPREWVRGHEHFSAVGDHIDALTRWVDAAKSPLKNSRRVGKTPQHNEARAVRTLGEIWKKFKVRPPEISNRPSEKELLHFVVETLKPVRVYYESAGNLAGHVHTIYATLWI